MLQIQDPVKRSRVRRTLLIIIAATIPCYILGLIVLLLLARLLRRR